MLSEPDVANLVAKHVDVETDARKRVANFVRHVRGHSANRRQSLGLNETGLRGDRIRNIVGNDENATRAALAHFVAERSHQHVHQALVKPGDSLPFQSQRIASLRNFVDGPSKRRKPSQE